MKRIFSFLFAIITLVGTTGVFTSCQEDAPEINYTINITVNNDFTEVVNAINNGTMKQEAAIAALTAAINQMNGDQTAKLQALIESINTLATTLDAKLAIIEAAMKAQTLALETKLGLIEAAIKALPDYTDKLKAIEAAIKGMPDYSDKLAAIETAIKNIPDYSEKMAAIEAAIKNAPNYTAALEEIKKAIAELPDYTEQLGAIITAIEALPDYSTKLEAIAAAVEAIPDYSEKFEAIQVALEAIADNIEAQEGQYADELAAITEAIDAIQSEVAAGNKSQADALAEIIALLESGAIAGGGSGSGSGGEGEGGEGEDTTPYIAIDPLADVGDTFDVTYLIDQELPIVEGLEFQKEQKFDEVKNVTYTITNTNNVKLKGNITWIRINAGWIFSVDCTHMSCLEYFGKIGGRLTTVVDVSKNKNLKVIDLIDQGADELKLCKDVPGGYKEIYYAGNITKDWDKFIDSLPEADKSDPGKLFIYNFEKPSKESSSTPAPTSAQIEKANEKNYKVYKDRNFAEEYVVE